MDSREKQNAPTLCETFGMELPIFVWPGVTFQTPRLIAAASEAGALGVLSAGFLTAGEIRTAVEGIRALTKKPFAVQIYPEKKTSLDKRKLEQLGKSLAPLRKDLGLPEPDMDRIVGEADFTRRWETLLDLEVPVVGVSLGGLREPYMEALEARGIKTFGTAANLTDVKVLVSSGVDAVVAQGWGASGVRSFNECKESGSRIDSLSLLSECSRVLRKPFLADNSLLTEDGVKAVLSFGASGVVLSDAVLNSMESSLPEALRGVLPYMKDSSSEVIGCGMGTPARTLVTGIFEVFAENGLPSLDFPYQWLYMRDIFDKARSEQITELMCVEWGQLSYLSDRAPVESIVKKYSEWMKKHV